MLSSEVRASEYLIVYLRRGHIVVRMASSTRSNNTRLTSRYTYNDASWWQVRLLVVITSVQSNLAKSRIADLSPLAAENGFVGS